jgi:hypothetical protein
MLLLASAIAWGHGASFGAVAISVAPDRSTEAWSVVEGWGLAHSSDGGETWDWHCEEALGDGAVYGVLALAGGRAAVASRLGVLVVDGACGVTALAGLPEEAYGTAVVAYGDVVLAGVIAPDTAGIVVCDEATCTPSDVWGDGRFPKSIVVDGTRAWATVVEEATLAASLWRSDDGVAWTEVYAWPAGDTDPRVLDAEGDRLWIWRRTRDEAQTPGLLVSDDGGETFAETLTAGVYTDPAPGFVRLGETALLGSVYGARTWRSTDGGRAWTEVSADAPAVRCGHRAGDVAWVCADHLNDGFDVAVTTDGVTFTPVGCLEEAVSADCAAAACAASVDAYVAAGAYGGGQCDAAAEEAPAPEEGRCGCGGGGAAVVLVVVPMLSRRYRGQDSTLQL